MKVRSILILLINLCFIVVVLACESSNNQGNGTDGDLDGTDNEQDLTDKDEQQPPITDGDEQKPDPDGDLEPLQPDGDDVPDGDRIDGDTLDGDVTDGDDSDGDRDESESDGDSIDGDNIEKDDEEGDFEQLPAPVISEFFITENPANALSFFAEWVTDYPVKTKLNVDCGEEYRTTFKDSEPRVKHQVFVMGLFDGAHCDFEVHASSGGGATSNSSQVIEVGPLPDYLPEFTVNIPHPDKLQAGWTLFNLNNSNNGQPLLAVILDRNGRYRWYFRVPDPTPGSDNDMRAVEEGIWIGGTWGRIDPFLISWEGEILWRTYLKMHHVLRPWGDRSFLHLWGEKTCTGEDWDGYEDVSSGAVYLYDMDEGKATWSWVLCHHYTPPNIYEDWSHVNAVVPFSGNRSLLVSSRNQHLLFKVNIDTGQIVWKMGSTGDFEIADDDLFYRQHAPEVQANGNILLYDNGKSSRPYSRAIELAYTYTDEVKEAHVVWSFTPDPLIYTPIWGDADRLANGNTLITLGTRARDKHSRLMEASSDNPGILLWDLTFPLDWGVYRAQRIPDPSMGYVMPESELADGDVD